MAKGSILELEAVTTVARLRSFRAAASELEMSPSALSHAVSSFEQRLGTRLLHRTTRSVSLTPAGEAFVERVNPALREIATAMTEVDELREHPRGLLRLNAARTSAEHYVFPLVVEMRRRHPDVRVEIATEERFVDIVKEGYDAGFRLAESVPQDMVAIPLEKTSSMAIVGSPAYFARHPKPMTPRDLADHECIRRRRGSGAIYRWELEKNGRDMSIDVHGALTLDYDELMIEAARAGLGLAFVGELLARDDLANGSLVRVLAPYTPPFAGTCLFHPSSRLVPAALRAFVTIAKEARDAKRGRASPGARGNPRRGAGS